jgi:PAS domain S-box-containing protein
LIEIGDKTINGTVDLFRSIFTDSPIGIEIFDNKGKLIDLNQACMELFGISSKEEVKGFDLFNDPNVPKDYLTKLQHRETIRFESIFDFDLVKKNSLYDTTKSGITNLDVLITPLFLGENQSISNYLVQVQDISEQKIAEHKLIDLNEILENKVRERTQKLRKSEEKWRVLVDDAPDIIFTVDRNRRILYINKVPLGMTKDEAIGTDVLDYVNADYHETVITSIEEVFRTGNSTNYEISARGPNDTISWYSTRLGAIKQDGEVTSVMLITRDITERKKIEETAQQERDKAEMYLNLVNVIIVALDKDGNVILTNQKGNEILEWDEGELLGKNWFENCLPLQDRKEVQNYFIQLMAGEVEVVPFYENQVKTRNGEKKLIAWSTILFKDSEGKINGLLSSGEDITERKKAEAKIRESEKQLKDLIEAVPVGISITMPEGKILECNSTLLQYFGYYSKEEYLTTPVVDLYRLSSDRDKLVELLKSGLVKDFEAEFKRKDGSIFWGSLTSIAQKRDDQIVFINSFQDITNRKLVDLQIQQSEAELNAIYNYTPIAILLVDEERRIRKINKHALNFTDRKEEEVFGIHGGEALRCLYSIKDPLGCGFSEECQKCVIRNTVLDTFNSRNPHINVEATLYLLPGSERGKVHLLFSTVHLDVDGEERVLISMIDITERKKAEQELKDSEEKYRTLIQNIPGMIYRGNADWTTDFITNSEVISGYREEDFVSQKINWIDLIHPKDGEIVVNEGKSMVEKPSSLSQIYRIITKNGSIRWVNDRKISNFSDNGVFCGVDGIVYDITDRKKTEEELRKIDERLNHLASSGPTVVYTAKASGDYGATFISDNVKNITGYDPEEFTKNTDIWIKNVHPEDKDIVLSKLSRIKQEKDLGYEYRFKFKDGIYHWMRDESKLIFDENGKPLELVGSWSDITWSKKTEEKIQYQAKLVENVSDAIISTDLNFKIITWNNAAEQIYGWKAKEIIGKRVMETITVKYPDDDPKNVVRQVFREGFWKGEVIQPRKDGTLLNILASVSSIKDMTGKPIGVVAINHDITDRKLAEEKLKESEEKFRNIAEQTSLGLLIQQNGFIKFANSAVAGMSEYSLKKINSWSIEDLKKIILKDDQQLFDAKLKIIEKSDYNYSKQFECRIITKSGILKWLEIIAKPIIYLGNRATFTSLVDITAKKKLEAELKEISRLKSELLSRTSHELKTPLVSIKGYADLLLNQHYDALDFYTISVLHEIKQGCSRLESLIKDLIETSKYESGEIELKKSEEDLAFLIRFCIRDLQGLLEIRNHKLIIEIKEGMITLLEKERIYDVIINLLSNAIKYTPSGGTIKIQSEKNHDYYMISITDDGIGISTNEMSKIFQKFGKIERYGKGLDVISEGSGLGLYISKNIIELHGGNIWVESEGRNKGSTFKFSLPIIKK